jgi:polyhydroxyalkanoate synthase
MMGLDIFESGNRVLEKIREGKMPRVSNLKLAPTPYRVIHRENKLQVLLYEKSTQTPSIAAKRRTPILIIPSLINRHYILDLLPGKSLTAFLTSQGFDVATIDWGVPGREDKSVPFERYVDTYIQHAIQALNRETGTEKPVLLGYCLGGTMATIHAALHPESIGGLIALTAPINFHNSGLLSAWCRMPSYDVDSLIAAHGNVPWSLMQSTFQMLRPTMGASRALALLKRRNDHEYVESALALELWLSDNVSFPGECYRQMIKALYRDNALVNSCLVLNNELVDFKRITCPVLNVAASEDHIVPLDAIRDMESLVSSESYTEFTTPGGHIGAIISRRASSVLWPNMKAWLETHFETQTPVAAIEKLSRKNRFSLNRPRPQAEKAQDNYAKASNASSRTRVRPWQSI